MTCFRQVLWLACLALVASAGGAAETPFPTIISSSEAIEAAKKRPAQEAINREREREAETAVAVRAREFEAVRAEAWKTYERSNIAIARAYAEAARDARLGTAAQMLNILAITINYVAASDVVEADDAAEDARSKSDARKKPQGAASAISSSRNAPQQTGAETPATPSSPLGATLRSAPAAAIGAGRPTPPISSSPSLGGATSPVERTATRIPARPDPSNLHATVRQRIGKAEEALHFVQQHPASDFRQASIPQSLTPAELKIREGLAALNGLSPSAADQFEDAMRRRQQQALMGAGRDLFTGKVDKARNKLLLESVFPTVLSDGTKESRSYQNYLRRELAKSAGAYADVRCRQTTGRTCNFVDKLIESPCLGPSGCYGQIITPATPSSVAAPSIAPPP